jgi:dUTP pyrophosphatase
VVNKSENPLPKYARDGDAGMDICASEDVQIKAFSWTTIPTGIYLEIPEGYECQIRSRSGLAAKFGIFVLNSPGTIDSGYRGEVKIILKNEDHRPYEVKKGDRIAQMVFAPVTNAILTEVAELSDTDRGEGGLGSTGK